jgi:hypothetical protein
MHPPLTLPNDRLDGACVSGNAVIISAWVRDSVSAVPPIPGKLLRSGK